MYRSPTIKQAFPSMFGKCLGNTSHLETYEIGPKLIQKEPRSDEIIQFFQQHQILEGHLKTSSHGYMYLNISNRFIYNTIKILEKTPLLPPPYFTEPFADGAHISVALPQEEKKILSFPSQNLIFPFQLTGCYIANAKSWKDFEKIWFFTVVSPEIEAFRESIGLSKLICDECFYITIGVQKRFLSFTEILQKSQDLKASIEKKPSSVQKKVPRKAEEESF